MTELFDEAWERQYAAGRALNRYPFDIVVTLTSRYFGGVSNPPDVRVLDLGCGAGNHALFFARLGFNVTCVDVSSTALRVARQRFDDEGLSARFCTMAFEDIAALTSTFDLVLDRGALCCADYSVLRNVVMPGIRDLMKADGIFISCFFSVENPVQRISSAEPAGYTLRDLQHDTGGDPLRMTRLDRNAVSELFSAFRIVQLYHHVREELFVAPGEPALGAAAEYVVVCRRDAVPIA